MARRVYFHLGAPKTGTTYLQQILWDNRESLAARGVLFPGRRWLDRFFATLELRDHPNLAVQPRRARHAWRRLVAQTARFDGDVVISHEFFGSATAEQARRAVADLAPAEVHLVVTARDFVRQVPAAWQERIKLGRKTSLDHYVGQLLAGQEMRDWGWQTLDPAEILSRWGPTVPTDRVHIVTLPAGSAPPDLLWRRFAGVCGIDPAAVSLDQPRPNESLGVVQAELLRRVNRYTHDPIVGPRGAPRWVRGALAHQVLVPLGGERFTVSDESAKRLRARMERTLQYIAESGFELVGDRDDLLPAEVGTGYRQPDDVTDAELVECAAEAMAEMLIQWRAATLRAEAAEAANRGGWGSRLARRLRVGRRR